MRSNLKKYIIIIILLSFPAVSFSEDDVYFRAKKGDQALMFGLHGLSDFTAGNYGAGFGYQYYFANHFAYRISLGFSYSEEFKEKPKGTESDYTHSDTEFSLNQGIRYNFGMSGNVLAYIGGQLLFALSKEYEEGEFWEPIEVYTRYTTYGAGFFIGAEWFAWKNVSLSAEYVLGFEYSSGKTEVVTSNYRQEDKHPIHQRVSLGASSANFTISFFFD